MKGIIKFMKILLIIVVLIFFTIFIFIKLYPPLGDLPSKEDKKDYVKRANNFRGGKFHNIEEFTMNMKKDINYPKEVSNNDRIPIEKIPVSKPNLDVKPDFDVLNVTWLGHSSLLVQMHGKNILFDPVFSDRTSPFSFIGGSKRFSNLPITIEELPNIDIVIISHDHYDHLDYKTIKEIDSKVSKFVVPLGGEKHLERWGVNFSKITNMAWWESIKIDGLEITSTPASHFSGRNIGTNGLTLWSSWVLKDEYHQIYESGDTGFSKHFEQIKDKFKYFDLVMLDNAQYNKMWSKSHMNPEQAVDASIILNAKVTMPIHFGTFTLAPHAWDDSIIRFTKKAKEKNIEYVTPKIGETMNYSEYEKYNEEWWQGIK